MEILQAASFKNCVYMQQYNIRLNVRNTRTAHQTGYRQRATEKGPFFVFTLELNLVIGDGMQMANGVVVVVVIVLIRIKCVSVYEYF